MTAEKNQRILGLDLGEKRIGVALSDPAGLVALPLKVLIRTTLEKDLKTITGLIDDHRVKLLVVGHPLSLSGGKSAQTISVEEFVAALKKRTAAEVVFWDERLTSKEAKRGFRLIGAGHKIKKEIDAAAASLILQAYLDKRRNKSLD